MLQAGDSASGELTVFIVTQLHHSKLISAYQNLLSEAPQKRQSQSSSQSHGILVFKFTGNKFCKVFKPFKYFKQKIGNTQKNVLHEVLTISN